jgi:hypothetical protein
MLEFLTEGEVARLIRRGLSTLRNDRSLGRGVPYVKLGRSVRYAAADVQAYMDSHRIAPAERSVARRSGALTDRKKDNSGKDDPYCTICVEGE